MPGVMTDARNGFAAPRPRPKPVACGRSPTPSVVGPPSPVLAVGELVGFAERPKLPPKPAIPIPVVGDDTPLNPVPKPAAPLVPVTKPVVDDVTPPRLGPSPTPPGALTPLVPAVPAGSDTAAEAASSAGVVGSDCGIGGSASRSDAPKDEVGLKALTPALKPVACGRNGAPVGWLDSAVLPVGCPPNELRSESENVDPVAVIVAVEALVLDEPTGVNDEVVGRGACALPVSPVMNEEATLEKVVVGKPVCWGMTCTELCACCWDCGAAFVSSNSVGARGTGGGDGALGTPNGLREPVWWDLRVCDGRKEGFVCVSGVEAGRAGGPEVGPVILDVCAGIIGLDKFVEGSWEEDKKEKGWEIVGDWVGNGFEFGDGNGFGLIIAELFVGTENGFGFAAVGNGFIVCPVLGNGFAE